MQMQLRAALLALFLTSTLLAQPSTRFQSRPAIPPAEVLDRLHLTLAWKVYVPVEGGRDGIAGVQILGGHVLVQTRSGGITLLDAATGTVVWRARAGEAYRAMQAPGYNKLSVFIVSGDRLYSLSRTTGQLQWEMTLPNTPSAPPVADDQNVYVCLGTGRIYAYDLPEAGTRVVAPAPAPTARTDEQPAAPAKPADNSPYRSGGRSLSAVSPLDAARRALERQPIGPQPRRLWEYTVGAGRLEQAPLVTDEFLTLATTDGTFLTMSKAISRVQYRFRAEAPVAAPLGQHGETAYIVSQDYNVYALDIVIGRIIWRFLGAAAIQRQPQVTDEDVYITPERSGLYRLERASGQLVWQNRQAERFLAMNAKFVYAADASGRLLVLDRARGTQLSVYDGTRDFVVPVANDLTDRVFLAGNDGLIVCLHDKDYAAPFKVKNVIARKAPVEGKEPEKTDEKKEKGEEKKKEDK